jgi:hypothetical protein
MDRNYLPKLPFYEMKPDKVGKRGGEGRRRRRRRKKKKKKEEEEEQEEERERVEGGKGQLRKKRMNVEGKNHINNIHKMIMKV